jgi:hypothetical protein
MQYLDGVVISMRSGLRFLNWEKSRKVQPNAVLIV